MSVTLSQPLLLLLLGAWSGCVVEGDEEATTAHTLLLGQPQDLQVLESNITSTSIRLSWTMDTILPIEPIEGYRVFYMKNKYIDAKTFMGSKPEYTLTGLDPYTIYTVWVKAFGKDSESPESEKITVTTDTNVPSAPRLTNVTCYDTLKVGRVFAVLRIQGRMMIFLAVRKHPCKSQCPHGSFAFNGVEVLKKYLKLFNNNHSQLGQQSQHFKQGKLGLTATELALVHNLRKFLGVC